MVWNEPDARLTVNTALDMNYQGNLTLQLADSLSRFNDVMAQFCRLFDSLKATLNPHLRPYYFTGQSGDVGNLSIDVPQYQNRTVIDRIITYADGNALGAVGFTISGILARDPTFDALSGESRVYELRCPWDGNSQVNYRITGAGTGVFHCILLLGVTPGY
jgi:hypothetical protein